MYVYIVHSRILYIYMCVCVLNRPTYAVYVDTEYAYLTVCVYYISSICKVQSCNIVVNLHSLPYFHEGCVNRCKELSAVLLETLIVFCLDPLPVWSDCPIVAYRCFKRGRLCCCCWI